MQYYYVLDLTGRKLNETFLWQIEEYVNEKQFHCLNNDYIRVLANSLHLSFVETLQSVFLYFLKIEHAVTKRACSRENKDSELNPITSTRFFRDYMSQVRECKDKSLTQKCGSLSRLHWEDTDFLTDRKDKFLEEVGYGYTKEVERIIGNSPSRDNSPSSYSRKRSPVIIKEKYLLLRKTISKL